jgi:demethylmenaquinone methyltransferase/2-methoxy-6-polyprenyl-1,4-benzoquinol methylase
MKATGTTPPQTASEEQAARWVRGMFGRIAPRYDFLNHLLSFNRDRAWRRHTVARLRPVLDKPAARVLDLCCGTGDLALELATTRAQVHASDFCHPMLTAAAAKGCPRLVEADALELPLRDATFDAVTIAFGFRNFANYQRGLAELRRVIKPGGTLAILEFTTPPNAVFRAGYQAYSRHILPRLGGLLSGSRDAYTYLPDSVRKFPAAPELAEDMRQAGFAQAEYEYLTCGVVALHLGR